MAKLIDTDNPYADEAAWMVRNQIEARGVRDPRVLEAMRRVPRHRFVPDLPAELAYTDKALPTRDGQTISQPYIVAFMTELLRVRPGLRVLEVGTGSGYQTAVLACMGAQVVSIEQNANLAESATRTIEDLGLDGSVTIVHGDGSLGWAAGAPYDRILVTAAAPRLPRALREQLADGGRIVIPIGGRRREHLIVFERNGDHWSQQRSIPCVFVPLIGEDSWTDDDTVN